MHLRENTLLQGGEYRIKRFIDSGGFGCTYEAYQKSLDRRVAIKEFFWSEHCQRDNTTGTVSVATESNKERFEKLRQKFIREAQVIAKMHHPGIVRVSAVFEENGTAYYVMDYIEGMSLQKKLTSIGVLSEAEALRYIRQVSQALRYVHGQKRLHLDIKPGNIMVDGDDNAILIDFGVSKQYDETLGINNSTLSGYSKGFSSIEQVGGDVKTFTPATDIYSLGATLYALLVGIRPPESSYILKGLPIEPLQACGVSSTSIQAIRQAMRADKEDRPQSVAEFLAILDGKVNDEATNYTDKDKTHYNDKDKTHYQDTDKSGRGDNNNGHEIYKGEVEYEKDTPSRSNLRWLWVAVVGVLIGVGVVFGLRGCGDHQGEAVPVADATEVVIDSAATSTTLPALTEEVLSEAMQKEQEKEERLAALEQENQRLKEQRRQDSIAAVKKAEEDRKAEEERQAKEAAAQAALEAEAARKAEEARKAAAASSSRGTINGHEYVDLGLSVKWATCNVGASSPSDWGYYYEWGETSTFDDNSVTYGKTFGDISGDSRYDAARKHWGGSWRMPTRAECEELKDKCTWTWTSQGGHAGYRVTGPNGNSIFLPASGYRFGSSLYYQGEYGDYWGSTPDESDTISACSLYFDSSGRYVGWFDRYYGRTVRPVSE